MKVALAYPQDSTVLFAAIAHLPWAMYLDSGYPGTDYGRYDIMTAQPLMTLVTLGGTTEICRGECRTVSQEDALTLLQQALADFLPGNQEGLPFSGGAVGYFSYDLGQRTDDVGEGVPDMAVGIYDWAVVVDHQQREAWLVSQGYGDTTLNTVRALLAGASSVGQPFRVTGALQGNMSDIDYAAAFARVQQWIYAGDCYQVNLAQQFEVEATGDAWQAYQYLRQICPAPYAAYLNLPDMQVLCASPERFLRVHGAWVETCPIKGTRPRAADPEQDQRNADELRNSAKDQAENLMIVDLLRNDLGKTCVPGSIEVQALFELESFANVHHLVSRIRGRLAPSYTAVDVLRGCFPGGSITGAPKVRAMEIIATLEPHRRGVYCGAIGYIGFDGSMDTNIVIRTAVYAQQRLRFWAGGGIVADSVCDGEYAEILHKASAMMRLVEHFSGSCGSLS